ncbi:MAG: class I SAM-dependent methyltransferase [Verrucomicrobiota bacterium]
MSFDHLAPHYGRLERWLAGAGMHRARIALLNELKDPGHILIVGEGPGRFLVECRRRFPTTQITCIDASPRMLQLARERLKRSGLGEDDVCFVRADLLNWQPPPGIADVVVTNFVLDCFDVHELPTVIRTLSRAAAPDARWLLADFQIPATGFWRWRALVMVRMLYVFFRWTTKLSADRLVSPDEYLRLAKFKRVLRRQTDGGLLRSELWSR